MKLGTTRDSVVGAERELLSRLVRDEGEAVDRWGAPLLRFVAPVDVIQLPVPAVAFALGADHVAVQDPTLGRVPEKSVMLGALSEFIALHDAGAAAIARFAATYGSLRLCPCGARMEGHRRDVMDIPMRAAGVSVWMQHVPRRSIEPLAWELAQLSDAQLDAREKLFETSAASHILSGPIAEKVNSNGRLSEEEQRLWDDYLTTRLAFSQLRQHMAPESLLALPDVVGDAMPVSTGRVNRFGHLSPGFNLRVESVRHWRAEARRMRAIVVLAAFVAVALDEVGSDGLERVDLVPGFERGIPFAPAGARLHLAQLFDEIAGENDSRPREGDARSEAIRRHHISAIGTRQRLVDEVNGLLASSGVVYTSALHVPESLRVLNYSSLSDEDKDGVVRALLTSEQTAIRCGVVTNNARGFLGLQLAGLVSRTVSRRQCRRPGCARALTGRRRIVCDARECVRWYERSRKSNRRALEKHGRRTRAAVETKSVGP